MKRQEQTRPTGVIDVKLDLATTNEKNECLLTATAYLEDYHRVIRLASWQSTNK